jgi:isoleucyl-tRNA synthetase
MVVEEDRLGESRLGVWDGKTIEEFQKWFTNTNITFMERRPEGGETHREMMRRVASLLLECESKYKDRRILFVTHAGPANMMLSFAHHLSDTQIQNNLFDLNSPYYLKAGEAKEFEFKKVCYDENLNINLHRPYIDNVILKDSKGEEMRLIGDVFDCWFESGSMPFASLHYPFENQDTFQKNFPAHFIAESMDQTRGWFYSLINLGVGLFDKTPFIHVNCNGIINAADGKKISKSERNYTDPMLLVEKFGADAFRLYLMASPVVKGESINFADSDLEEVYKKNVLRFENVLEFYTTNKKSEVRGNTNSNDVLDKWMLNRLTQLINDSIKGYDAFKLDEAVSGISSFVDDLSTWYLRRSRDKLKDGNVETLGTMRYLLTEFAKVVAPIMPFLAERVYQEVEETKESVHLTRYPSGGEVDLQLIEEMRKVRGLVADALMLRQKSNLPVRQPLSKIVLNQSVDPAYFELIMEELNVKSVEVNESATTVVLDTNLTPELIHEGKQRELSRGIKDLRKELGLTPADSINLTIDEDRYGLIDEEYSKAMKILKVSKGDKLEISKA